MTMPCDDVRELLAEYLYDEIDRDEAGRVRAHLDECPACTETLQAFGAAREDLARLGDIEVPGSPARIAFVAPPSAAPRTAGRTSAWLRTAAVAASFVLGLFLTAAAVNLQVEADDDGWTMRTSLWPAVAAETGGEVADAAGTEEAEALSSDAGPAADSVPPSADDAAPAPAQRDDAGLTAAQRAEVNAILTRVLAEHRRAMSADFQQLVAASELSQQQEFRAALASLYEALELQHAESYLTIASELGPVLLDTGERLDQADAAIDYLITQVGARPNGGAGPERER